MLKYTRNQFSRIFGISMESLRYLEKMGVIQVERNEENHYMEYRQDQIPMIHSIKTFQSAGISLDSIVPLSTQEKVPDHTTFIEQCMSQLEEKKKELDASLRYLHFIHRVYRDETKKLQQLQFRSIDECYFVQFDEKGRNSDLIHECMKTMPHLDLIVLIHAEDLSKTKLPVSFGLDLPLHIEPCARLIDVVKDSKELKIAPAGLYVYKVIFKENVLDIRQEDIEDMLNYAKEHQYTIDSDLFGFVMGPETLDGKNGFYIRMYLLLQKE